ncbi:MAG: O-antigen ligase family protein [Pyrinomonadaceae bacterium]
MASLLLLALAAPLSIAGTQIAWSLALFFWIVRAMFVRPKFSSSGFDLAVITFVGLSILSAVFSYEPEVSMRKLVGVSLVTIVYLVSANVSDIKTVRWLTAILIFSGLISVAYVLGTLAVGKNLKVTKLAADSPLRVAGVEEGDTILKANGQNVSSPSDLIRATAEDCGGPVEVTVYRHEVIRTYALLMDPSPSTWCDEVWLGIAEWSRGRDTRAAGFFGHYTTYAEAIQLILSVAFALLVVLPGSLLTRNRIVLAAVVVAFSAALFLTVTRASWAGFALSAAIIVLIGASKRTVLICAAIAIPLTIAGLVYLQQKRNVAFIDTKDGSTIWRMTVWREAVDVLTSSPRHLAVGVGMDSIKTHWREWEMFDEGRLPTGHMHSTPLQIAFERGIPALMAWIAWMYFYLRMLWRSIRRSDLAWPERGILLGCFGGGVGFIAGGLVHNNWGDSEVVMIFYLLMGLGLAANRLLAEKH